MRPPCQWISSVFILLILVLSACSPAAPETAAPQEAAGQTTNSGVENINAGFEEEECRFGYEDIETGEDNENGDDLGFDPLGGRVRCGSLVVPERRGDPDSPTLRLSVVILKSSGDETVSDPLFVTFGPYYMGAYFFAFTDLFNGYLDQREIVILDPRGTGRGGLNLDCPEITDAFRQSLELEFNSPAVRDTLVTAHQTCRSRADALVGSIQNLNIVEMADDFEDLRQLLGYEKVNVSALGTGVRIAETWASRHPESIRTITMVSPVPQGGNIYARQVESVDRVLQASFAECAASEPCNKAYPNLYETFKQVVADLNIHPLTVDVNYLSEGSTYHMRLNGDRLIDLAYTMVTSGYTDWIGFLPQIIYKAKDGDTAPAAGVMSNYIDFISPGSPPLTQGIWCSEILDEDAQAEIQEAIDAAPAVYTDYFKHGLDLQKAVCEVWGSRSNLPENMTKERLTIPVLVLASPSDLVAPGQVSGLMSERYTPAFTYEFTGGGGVTALAWWSCWSEVQTAFMEDPSIPPQKACSQKIQTISWITFSP